ncbi:MAG: ParB/RepB/Spo0J family partition protein [Patescibacteria group bacterium]
MQDSIQTLDIEVLEANPFQPRNKIKKEDLEELAASIKQFGVLEPLVIAKTPAGYQIIAGERRWRAAKEAGLKEVPVVIKETSPREMLEMALIENVQRIDLHAMERAQAFQQLKREFNYSLKDISKSISKSLSFVTNTFRLLTLPDAVKDGLAGGLISEGHARALGGLNDDPSGMIKIYKQLLVEEGSVRRAEELVRDYKSNTYASPLVKPRKKITRNADPQFKEWQEKLQKILRQKAENVQVALNRSHKQTRLIITIKGDLDTTQPALEKIMKLTDKTASTENKEQ